MIGDAVRVAIREQADAMERLCEASLVDPLRRGVLVHDRIDLDALSARMTAELSAAVPWASIERHEVVGAGSCRACGTS
ncbi:hypothetical protein A9Z40_03220 [Microbacterium arborescens]|uniref:Uncharacterized protein n=1 Tax=Microbacterium arborescens TaxID=33883 RepID=A0ABX2WIB7_9MICO|nr:hypothetical protein [Microbacterium arborescens]OAZ40966.1 hypothetical protein A9Z40_03220 [Microbacterium arborescens]